MKLVDAIGVDVKRQFTESTGNKAKKVLEKFNNVFDKNDGFRMLKQVLAILNGQELQSECIKMADVPLFKYAPITSCEREFFVSLRLFSKKIEPALRSKISK